MKSIFKVQCVSTNCGYYNDLKPLDSYLINPRYNLTNCKYRPLSL